MNYTRFTEALPEDGREVEATFKDRQGMTITIRGTYHRGTDTSHPGVVGVKFQRPPFLFGDVIGFTANLLDNWRYVASDATHEEEKEENTFYGYTGIQRHTNYAT